MSTNATQRITIDDFRAGIQSDYRASRAVTPSEGTEGSLGRLPGAATLEGTHRCCADRVGALMPLPALTVGKSSQRLPTADNAPSNYLTGMEASYLLDAAVLTDMFVEGDQVAADSDRAAVFTMHGQWFLTDAFRWTVITTMHRPFEGGQQDLMWAKGVGTLLQAEAAKAHLGGGNFTTFRARQDPNSNFTYQTMAWVAYGSPGYSANPPDWVTGAIPAAEQALTTFDNANGATYPDYDSFRLLGLFPDYDALGTAQSKFLTIAGFTAVTYLATHQGRLIGASRDHGPFGQTLASDIMGTLTEHIHYTPPFDFDASLGIGALEFGTFGETKPYLSGVVASITANDLLLIKDHAGGVLVRGDLDRPTVVALPFVHSTHGVRSIPAATPFGLFYGTRHGVYIWTGGEASEHASPQIDGWFWNHDTEGREYLGSHGRFAWWEPWVCAPNNFLYDTRHASWWRIDDVASNKVAYSCYDVAPSSNRLYAFPWKLDDNNQVLWREASPEALATDYSWRSHPLVETVDRTVSVRLITLLATGSAAAVSTVDVQLFGYDLDGALVSSPVTTFNLAASERPQLHDLIIEPNFVASYIQVQIVADGGTEPAPKVHSVSIDFVDRARRQNRNT